jgi:hypothetical protein
MNIQIACLCDAATDYQGKLNLLGTFDTIFTRTLPAVHPSCAIVLRAVFSRDETGTHRIRLNFVNDDGQPVIQALDLPFEIRLPQGANTLSRNFIVNLQQIKFDRAGSHSVDVAIDGRHEVSIPLSIRQVPDAAENTPLEPPPA